MHLIITDAWFAKSRAVHLTGTGLVATGIALSLGLMVVALVAVLQPASGDSGSARRPYAPGGGSRKAARRTKVKSCNRLPRCLHLRAACVSPR